MRLRGVIARDITLGIKKRHSGRMAAKKNLKGRRMFMADLFMRVEEVGQ